VFELPRRAARPAPFGRAAVTAVLAAGVTLATAAAPASAACDANAAPPRNADPGKLVIADGFEHGDFGSWTRVVRGGDATVRVQSSTVRAGGCVAAIHVSARSTSRASIAKSLPSRSREIWATGWFDITRQGAKRTSNVPTFRFFSGSTRVLDVSRQNGSGSFFVRWRSGSSYASHATGRTLALHRWYQIKVHAIAAGSRSEVTVWLDGVKVLARTSSASGFASFGSATTLTSLQVGAEHVRQDGDFAADDIVARVG
jgi:hypothetical protein